MHQIREDVNHTELFYDGGTTTNGLYSCLHNVPVRISKYKLFLLVEDIDIRDVIIKSGKCKGESGIRKEKMEQVSHFALCSVFNLILGGTAFLHQNAFRKYRIQEMTGQKNQSGHAVISRQVRSPLQITGITTDVGSTHDASLVTLQMKRREITLNRKEQ